MKNKLNKIFKAISTVIFVILIILIVIILGYVLRVKYLASTGRLGDIKMNFYTILTQSMVPTIYAGDVIVTYKNDDNKYEIGDILTYKSDLNGGINITHRIKESYVVNGKYSYKTKGDNNSVEDAEIVKGEKVLGKVIFKIPKVGYFQRYLVNNRKLIICILIASLSVVIYDVVKLFEGIRKKGNEESFDDNEIESEDYDDIPKQDNEKEETDTIQEIKEDSMVQKESSKTKQVESSKESQKKEEKDDDIELL